MSAIATSPLQSRLFGWRIADRGLRIEEVACPWDSPHADLAEARRLIVKHGYWRRKEELEDAEAAARDWPNATLQDETLLPPKHFG